MLKASGNVFLGHLRESVFHIFPRLHSIMGGAPDTFQNFRGSCYNIQFKQYTTSKIELFKTKEFQLKTISLVYIIKLVRKIINPLSANPTKRLNTLKQLIDFGRRLVWVYLTILWGWCLKGQGKNNHILSGKPALGAAMFILILLHVPLK